MGCGGSQPCRHRAHVGISESRRVKHLYCLRVMQVVITAYACAGECHGFCIRRHGQWNAGRFRMVGKKIRVRIKYVAAVGCRQHGSRRAVRRFPPYLVRGVIAGISVSHRESPLGCQQIILASGKLQPRAVVGNSVAVGIGHNLHCGRLAALSATARKSVSPDYEIHAVAVLRMVEHRLVERKHYVASEAAERSHPFSRVVSRAF